MTKWWKDDDIFWAKRKDNGQVCRLSRLPHEPRGFVVMTTMGDSGYEIEFDELIEEFEPYSEEKT